MSKNLCAKTVSVENAYEVWEQPNGWKHYVLKKYQSPEKEAENPYARWFCYVEGDYNESGDVYVTEVTRFGTRIR